MLRAAATSGVQQLDADSVSERLKEELERLASSVKSDFDSHKGTFVRSRFSP